MRLRRSLLISTGLVALVVAGTPATGEPDARDDPTVHGRLILDRETCEPPQKTMSDTGEVGVVTRKCIWLYRFDSASETDNKRDYGVAWAQTWLSPRNGWCLKQATSGILNNDRHILKKVPAKDFRVSRKKQVTTKLVATAGGKSKERGVVKQTFPMLPGTINTRMDQGGRFFKVAWNGATKKPVAFALGIEVWWDPDTQMTTNAGVQVESRLRRTC